MNSPYERYQITPDTENYLRRRYGQNRQGAFPNNEAHIIISLLDEVKELRAAAAPAAKKDSKPVDGGK